MSERLLRKGPRFTFWADVNMQWLWPRLKFSNGLGYLHLGWLSVGFGLGRARDAMWDAYDKGLGLFSPPVSEPESLSKPDDNFKDGNYDGSVEYRR